MPAGTTPCGRPASHSASHSSSPRSIGAYSSQPRSPTYEMRDAMTPLSSSCHVEKGNASFDTSVPVIEARTLRARGRQMPTVQTDDVWSSMRVPSGQWSRNRSEEHTSELQSRENLVCRLLLEKKKD